MVSNSKQMIRLNRFNVKENHGKMTGLRASIEDDPLNVNFIGPEPVFCASEIVF